MCVLVLVPLPLTVMLMGHIGPVCARGRVGGGYIGSCCCCPSSRGAVVRGDGGRVCGVLVAAERVPNFVYDAAHGDCRALFDSVSRRAAI